MRLKPRHFLLGLCLTLVGASPARETGFSGWEQSSREFAPRALPALAAGEDGRFCLEAAGRRFEFGEGQVAVSAGDSSWTYRFHGAKEGIRALSVSILPEQSVPGSLEYKHDLGIVERYVVESRGVEQQFVLRGPHAGGDVLLTGSVQTKLVPDLTSSFEGIAFRRGDVTVLYYGEAKAIDAAGKTALLEERWSQGELTIVVPASFLAGAKFPVLVDPFIGSLATVDSAVDLAQNPAVATTESTAPFRALAVWSTNVTGAKRIRGRIIDPRGNTLVGPISAVDEVFFLDDYYTNPRVAWSGTSWVVAANGHAQGGANPVFIQVNRVDTAGTKTTGMNLNATAGSNIEGEVDVACNAGGQCLVVWAWDSDNSGTTDSIRGVFYIPGTNTFGSTFSIITTTTGQRSHPRVASNGTDFFVVLQRNDITSIDSYSVTSGGAIQSISLSQSGTARLHPEVSHNDQLGLYLVLWDDGSTGVYGSVLTDATPPVALPGVAPLFPMAQKPEATSQEWMGWEMAVLNFSGTVSAIALVRPNGTITSASLLAARGGTPSVDVAHFFRGLSVVVYEDDLGSATDHDIRGHEFITPATEYADFDNNGYASGFVWRPGPNAYFYFNSDLPSSTTTSVQFGTNGDIPVRTDFLGKGTPDLTVFRPSSGYWYTDVDRNGTVDGSIQFGAPGDIPVPGDYDGDGLTDLAVFRPSTGYWYILTSSSGFLTTISVQFGTNGDIPVPGYYSGFFLTSIAVWRPSNGTWYVDVNHDGTVDFQVQFGTAGDIPVPGDYGPSSGAGYPDGVTDFAVFRPSTGTWYVSRDRGGLVDLAVQFGTNGDIPVGGIYDSNPDINSPFAVFRPSNGTWYVDTSNKGTVDVSKQFGTAGDIPMQQPSGQYRN